jgi:hypothetical protein
MNKIEQPSRGEMAIAAEHFPIEKAKGTRTCWYCYERHANWWLMDPREYSRHVLLCGKCEHVS